MQGFKKEAHLFGSEIDSIRDRINMLQFFSLVIPPNFGLSYEQSGFIFMEVK